MEANKILNSDILDIIFDGKNKSYGAYDLRKTYNGRLKKALVTTGGLLLFIFLASILANAAGKRTNTIEVTDPIVMGHVKDEKIPEPVIPKQPKVEVINQVIYVKPVVVADRDVKPDQVIEEIHDNQAISDVTIKSENTDHIIQAPVVDDNSTIAELPVKSKDPDIWIDVQIQAEFPGGFTAWKKYLEKNLDPETAINNGAPEGTYTVKVNFIVSKDGSISNVTATTNIGYGLEEEAIKIIKKGPKWNPAIQNGQQVNAYRNQPITFLVTGN